MTCLRKILSLSCVLVLSATAWGQAAIPEPVIGHIPAGAMGFVVVNNIESMTGKVDKFIGDLGFGGMLAQPDPSDPEKTIQMSVLDMMRGAAALGDGFNPKGGLAAVLLDFKAFDIDIMEMIGGAMGGNADNSEAKPKPKLPVVIFLPGKDVKSLLGAYNPEQAGKYMKVMLPGAGEMLAGQAGSYVILSPNAKALDAVASATKKVPSELPAEQLKAISQSDIAYVMNGKIAGPVLAEIMQVGEAQMAANAGEMAPLVGTYFRIYRELLTQMGAVTVAGRFVEGGLVFDELIAFQPDTPYAKAMESAKLTGKTSLNALPDLPYVLAIGASASTSKQNVQMGLDMINSLMLSQPLANMPNDLKTSITKLYEDVTDQVTGMQMVGGGAPEGAGLFGVAFVIKCKDSDKMKSLLAEKARIAQALIKHFGADEPDLQKLSIKYVKGATTVGAISADAVVIEHPEMDNMEERERGEMKKVLGEDKINFRIAATDKNTVVITIGGSNAFLAETVKVAASGTGKIGTDSDSAKALKHMPAERQAIILFSPSNLYDVVVSGMKIMAPETELPPFKITSKTPIAIGAGTTGKSAHLVFFVPTDLIKDVAGIFMMFKGMGAGAGAAPMGDGDF